MTIRSTGTWCPTMAALARAMARASQGLPASNQLTDKRVEQIVGRPALQNTLQVGVL